MLYWQLQVLRLKFEMVALALGEGRY